MMHVYSALYVCLCVSTIIIKCILILFLIISHTKYTVYRWKIRGNPEVIFLNKKNKERNKETIIYNLSHNEITKTQKI